MTIGGIAGGTSDHVKMRMEKSEGLLLWLAGELGARVERPEEGEAPRRVGRLFMQVARTVELVRLAIDQALLNGDLGLAWILLEQARQQVGHAANGAGLIGEGPLIGAEQSERERESLVQIGWFLQRDLMPWPDDVGVQVAFGEEQDARPDFRPDTALEILPLQFLANAAMSYCAGEVVEDLKRTVMRMAFGEYVWKILEEACELLEFGANLAGEEGIEPLVETGLEVAYLVSGAFPPAEQIFHGPAGLPDD